MRDSNGVEFEYGLLHGKRYRHYKCDNLTPIDIGPDERPVYRRQDVIDEANRLATGPVLSVLDVTAKEASDG